MDVESPLSIFHPRGTLYSVCPRGNGKWNKTRTRRNASRTQQTADGWRLRRLVIVVYCHCIIQYFVDRRSVARGRLARTPTGRARGCVLDGWRRAWRQAWPLRPSVAQPCRMDAAQPLVSLSRLVRGSPVSVRSLGRQSCDNLVTTRRARRSSRAFAGIFASLRYGRLPSRDDSRLFADRRGYLLRRSTRPYEAMRDGVWGIRGPPRAGGPWRAWGLPRMPMG